MDPDRDSAIVHILVVIVGRVMAGKRRFIGPSGAVFVPNVDELTIKQMVAAGEWTPVPAPEAPKKSAAPKPSSKK